MATILVYNQDTNKIERYTRNLNEAMPYVTGNTLTVDEFQGSSKSDIIWTTKAFMQAWNSLRRQWGKPIYVGYAFKRIWQGGHSGMSQHYAGLAFDGDADRFLAVDEKGNVVDGDIDTIDESKETTEDEWDNSSSFEIDYIRIYSKNFSSSKT